MHHPGYADHHYNAHLRKTMVPLKPPSFDEGLHTFNMMIKKNRIHFRFFLQFVKNDVLESIQKFK